MQFRLAMQGAKSRRDMIYDTHSSTLRWADDGSDVDLLPVRLQRVDRQHRDAIVVTPDNPGLKSPLVGTLKIQLGLRCNYACSYCNQASQPQDEQGDLADVQTFLAALDGWIIGAPARVEFWGGEPLAYWKSLRPLAEALRLRWPGTMFSMVTNGSLLDDIKLEWLARQGFAICISHDGPGHVAARGADPFDIPEQAAMFRKAWKRLHPLGRLSFNCVLTRGNESLDAIRCHIAQGLEVDPRDVVLNTEEVLLPYDLGGMAMSPLKQEDHATMHEQVFNDIVAGMARDVVQVRSKINDFFGSIATGRPVMSLGQKCGMDREDNLAVDLKGSVITCQNTSASTKHRMGSVSEFDQVRLTQAHHFSTRPECLSCPVVQLCKGACMFLEGPLFEQACSNSYTYNTAVLKAALYFLTGSELVGISMDEGVS